MDALIRAGRAYWRWNQKAAEALAGNLDAAAVTVVLVALATTLLLWIH